MTDKHICGYRRVQGRQDDDVARDEYRLEGARCSYCGSVSQEAFLKFVEEGGEVGPTDKNNKVYLNGPDAPGSKFYFYHLDAAGEARFIELYNQHRMRVGAPGYFYQLPFFCSPFQ